MTPAGEPGGSELLASPARRPDVFVVPTYAVGQVENVLRTTRLAASHGFSPVIVCNSAKTAELLAADPIARSVGDNMGYGGAAALVAPTVEFETMILCNDDLVFTDAAMGALRSAVGCLGHDGDAIMGFLPRDRPLIIRIPGVLGLIGLVSGLSAVSRRRLERQARRVCNIDRTTAGNDAQPLPDGFGFPFVCIAFTRGAWDGLGGFDARFPLYFEDTDLLTRAHRSGTVQVSVALGDCTHLHSATARTVLPYIVPLMSVGARNYLQVHRRLPRTVAAILVTTALVIRAAFWVPVRPDRRTELQAVLLAVAAAWSPRHPRMPPWS